MKSSLPHLGHALSPRPRGQNDISQSMFSSPFLCRYRVPAIGRGARGFSPGSIGEDAHGRAAIRDVQRAKVGVFTRPGRRVMRGGGDAGGGPVGDWEVGDKKNSNLPLDIA